MLKKIQLLFILAVIPLLASGLTFAQTEKSQLNQLSVEVKDQQAILHIVCSKPFTYEFFSLLNPNRLVIDIGKVAIISTPPLVEIKDFGIQKITTSSHIHDTARIVVYFIDGILNYAVHETEQGLDIIFVKEISGEARVIIKEVVSGEEVEKPKVKPVRIKEEKAVKPGRIPDLSVGGGLGYFFFRDEVLQEVYKKNTMEFRVEASYTLPINFNNIDLWIGGTFFKKKGHFSLFEEDQTSWGNMMISAAVRYLRKLGRFTPFIGGGIDYISFKESYPDSEFYPDTPYTGSELGFHVQAGLYVNIISSVAAKIQVRYVMGKHVSEDEIGVNLGGIEYALSFVYLFDLNL